MVCIWEMLARGKFTGAWSSWEIARSAACLAVSREGFAEMHAIGGLLILKSVHIETNNPRPSGQASQYLLGSSQAWQTHFELVDYVL
jgi:hypothetical protein